MAATETNYWKIGLFVAVGSLLGVAAVFWLAAQRLNRELLPSVTYFDESVQGLDIGAPVKMRGVTIGNVSKITFAPDQRLVEVHSDIYADVMRRIGFPYTADGWQSVPPPDDLRVQLTSSGITGVKFLAVDFFEPDHHPVLALTFDPPARYVPSTRSALKTFEGGLLDMIDRAPPLMEDIRKLVATTESRVAEFDAEDLAKKLSELARTMTEKLEELDLAALGEEGTGLMRDVRSVLARLDEDQGPIGELIASWSAVGDKLQQALDEAQLGEAGRAIDEALGELGALSRTGQIVLQELRADLEELREALGAMRRLADYIERDPGALIRGRSRAGS